jgi:hypothetical protein
VSVHHLPGHFRATCDVPGCDHRPNAPGCELRRKWTRQVLAAVSEGHCPHPRHGRLEPADPPPTDADARVVASGICWPCGAAQWTVGEDWWQWDISRHGRPRWTRP